MKAATFISCILLASFMIPVMPAQARSFRDMDPILQPEEILIQQQGRTPVDPEIAQALPPLDTALVPEAIRDLAENWNSGRLGQHLDPSFYNRERLLEAITTTAPRDAKLKIINIRDIRPLDVRVFNHAKRPGFIERVALVSATVDTQIEFNSPRTGWQRLPGTSEFLLQVSETFSRAGGR